ncbi:MAG: terminase small subunit [Gammaproteobacteria bacterium]|nr:terminase small subunit [Gammaproteobacteria bacterium]
MTLTLKQEAFCKAYIELGNATEAYRQSYDAVKMQPATVNRKAKELIDNGKIAARLDELRAEHLERHNVTIDSLIIELEDARKTAKDNMNPSAMVSATMGKAKLMGLDKPNNDNHSGEIIITHVNAPDGC